MYVCSFLIQRLTNNLCRRINSIFFVSANSLLWNLSLKKLSKIIFQDNHTATKVTEFIFASTSLKLTMNFVF